MLCVSWNNFVNSEERVIVDILIFNFCSLYIFVLIPLIAIRKWNNMWERNISYHCIDFFPRKYTSISSFSEKKLTEHYINVFTYI